MITPSRRAEQAAHWLAARSFPDARSQELRNHLDESSRHGEPVTAADVGSLALLCLRQNLLAAFMVMAGGALFCLGLVAMAFPFVSVAQLSAEAIDRLPDVAAVGVSDDARGVRAIFDGDDFVLATRTYKATTIEQVEAALATGGFSKTHRSPEHSFDLECCGDYGWLEVYLETVGEDVVATTSAGDADATITWPILLFFGGTLTLIGAALLISGRRRWQRRADGRQSLPSRSPA